MDWITLISALGTLLGGLGLGMFTKAGRVKSQSDAYKAMAEGYEFRIDALHDVVKKCNETEKMHATRISEQNAALNDKTDQIRKLTNELIASERKANEVNDRLTREQEKTAELERENGDLREENAYLRQWVCEKAECDNGIPPRERLKGKRFDRTRLRYARETKRKTCDTAKEIINVNINENVK